MFFAVVVLAVNILTFVVTIAIIHLIRFITKNENFTPDSIRIYYFLFIALLLGLVISMLTSSFPLKWVRNLNDATKKIAKGDYSVRVEEKGPTEIMELNHSFNYMAQELSSVELLRKDFVDNFSHEFKTPITSIIGFAKLLRNHDDLSKEEQNEYLDIIIEESQHLSDLSANILNVSKLENQSILTDVELCDVSELIRTSIVSIEMKWSQKNIDIKFDSDEICLYGNQQLLKELFINLLDNAVKFSPVGGVVKIKTKLEDDECQISISNMGAPITKEQQNHLFEKFYQVDASHSTNGSGLGLTIVKRIVELHQGKIEVKSDHGYNTFTVTLNTQINNYSSFSQ